MWIEIGMDIHTTIYFCSKMVLKWLWNVKCFIMFTSQKDKQTPTKQLIVHKSKTLFVDDDAGADYTWGW